MAFHTANVEAWPFWAPLPQVGHAVVHHGFGFRGQCHSTIFVGLQRWCDIIIIIIIFVFFIVSSLILLSFLLFAYK